jgi:polysaccharide deacetylase 2 family uncharacterized protein YibQ
VTRQRPRKSAPDRGGGRLPLAVALGLLGAVVVAAIGLVWLWPEPGTVPAGHGPTAPGGAPATGSRVAPSSEPAGPRAAIVIDDLGRHLEPVEGLLAMGEPFTFSVLPYLPHSREAADLAYGAGEEVLLHLPTEPLGYPRTDPGEGALFVDMPEAELAQRLENALHAVPHIVGVNNHMGSRFTEEPAAMAVVMEGLRRANLFFLDSRTTPYSVAEAAAAEMGVPFASRDIFLDNDRTAGAIAGQIDRLIAHAVAAGTAIAIGHPHPETLAALAEGLPRLREAGVTIVPVSALVVAPDEGM